MGMRSCVTPQVSRVSLYAFQFAMLSIHKSDEPCHARALWAFPAPDLTELRPSIWRKSDSLNFGSWFFQLHFFHVWMVSQIFATMFIKITMLLK